MATKTKEEHLRQLEQEDRDFASKIREEQWIQHREMRAEALAERDAAREEAADWKSKFEHADATAEQVLGLWNGTLGMREELAQARNRIEFLENGAAPVDAAQPAEDVAPKLREALALSLGADPSRPIWALVNEAIGRIRFLEVAAQPESAPVVGGVTEAMLDEIGFHAMATNQLGEAIDRARAAIRAQKRVDVEAIREVAHATYVAPGHGHKLLRAIGDEHAEAPVAEPAAQPRLNVGDLVRSRPSALWHPFQGRIEYIRGSVASVVLESSERHHCSTSVDNLELVAEPAAPAQEQEGPYNARGLNLWENGKVIAWCNAFADLNKLVRLLNLGVEAEKLRARVAELEKSIGEMYERCRENSEAWAVLTGRNWWQTRDEGSLLLAAKDVKARADAAEAKVAKSEASNKTLWKLCADAIGFIAEPNTKEHELPKLWMLVDDLIEQMKDAKSKLAALGENPIPRALGERWHSYASGLQSGAWFAELLAGREPGVAS